MDRILRRLTQIPGARSVWRKFPLGSVETRVRYGIFPRSNYAYGVYHAALQAQRLGLRSMTAIEFGVAGGRGLLALEAIAAEISTALGIEVQVAGFDGGTGMPPPLDYRDLPYVWGPGFYKMDEDTLRRKLKPRTQLVIGNVAETVARWRDSSHAPIGFVSFDLDYYSSTMQAFQLFETNNTDSRLPRAYCYFDDIVWPEHALHNDYVGELCAIREFNESHEKMKLAPIHLLRKMRVNDEMWNEQMYVLHDFTHPLYSKLLTPHGVEYTQLPI